MTAYLHRDLDERALLVQVPASFDDEAESIAEAGSFFSRVPPGGAATAAWPTKTCCDWATAPTTSQSGTP